MSRKDFDVCAYYQNGVCQICGGPAEYSIEGDDGSVLACAGHVEEAKELLSRGQALRPRIVQDVSDAPDD